MSSGEISDAKRKLLEQKYREFKQAPKYDLNSEELYCVCRQTDDGELMVCCDGCDEWFHFKCMKINVLYKDLVNNYFCEFCDVLFDKGRTLWKKKCMLPSCYKPIRITDDGAGGKKTSKYCSDEHGLKYMSDMLNKRFLTNGGEANSKDGLNREEIVMALNRPETLAEFKRLGNGGMPEFKDFYKAKTGMEYQLPIEVSEKLSSTSKDVNVLQNELKIVLNKHKYLIRLKDKIRVFNDQIQRIEELKQQREEEEEEKEEKDEEEERQDEEDAELDGAEEAMDGVESNTTKRKKPKSSKKKKKKKKKKIKADICGFESHLKLGDVQWLQFEAEDSYKLLIRDDLDTFKDLEDMNLEVSKFENDYDSMTNGNNANDNGNNINGDGVGSGAGDGDNDGMDVDLDSSYFKGICIKDKKKCNKHATWFSIFNDRFKFRIDELRYEINELETKRNKILVDLNIRSWEAYQLNELSV